MLIIFSVFWGLSYYFDRVQLEFKANQDREKIKGSILYNNKLFQSDLISRNVSFYSSILFSHVWIISHRSRNQNISLPLSLFCFTSVTCLASSIDIIFCWNNGNDAFISMYLFSFLEWDPNATWDNQMQAMHRMCITM